MAEQHKFIPFEPTLHLTKSLRDPAFKAAYDALEDEFSALDALLNTRGQTEPTLAEVTTSQSRPCRACRNTNKVNFAGGRPATDYLSCLAKKGNPKKATPVYRPCGVPSISRK